MGQFKLFKFLVLLLIFPKCLHACWDSRPSAEYTCVEQRDFGQCGESWMIEGGYCDITCGRCCGDVPPGDVYTCEEQASFGNCNEPWMTQENFCAKSCGRCAGSAGIKTSTNEAHQGICTDEKPEGIYTCTQQKAFGFCTERWMLDGDFCAFTCGRCDVLGASVARSGILQLDQSEPCSNNAPDDTYTCPDQKRFGKCNEEWMIDNKYCQYTCGRCESAQKICTNSAPDDKYSCQQHKGFGNCNKPWMKEGKFCEVSCGVCNDGSQVSDCYDTPPDNVNTCWQQKEWGKCDEDWIKNGGFCDISCGRCQGSEVDEAATTPTRIAPAPSNGRRRNFLIIMSDDQGYDDIGIHNPGLLETPNMDKFARESVQFSNFYTDSLCAPTRATLMTGRHHLKTGVWGVHGGMDFIDLTEVLMAQPLQDNGYFTAQVGKWHSGKTDGYLPFQRGYEISLTPHLYTFINNRVRINGVEQRIPGWVEEWMAGQIVQMLEGRIRDGRPFYITWTPMSIHAGVKYEFNSGEDFIAPDWALEKYANKGLPEDIQKVYAFLTYWDTVFGFVIDKLSQLGLAEDTTVMFFGDNGPMMFNTDHRNGENRILRMPSQMLWDKGFIEEGGTRNFLFVQQKGSTPAKVVNKNTYVADIFPTVMELAGITPALTKPLDGFSLVPLLFGNSWRHDGRIIITHESLKNTLVENLQLQLGSNRRVDLFQRLLNFDIGATNGIGLKYWTAIRRGDFKLIKTHLYNIKQGDHKEWPQHRLDDRLLASDLEDRARKWWENMLSTEYSAFQKPIFYIGLNGAYLSELLPYAAHEWSPFSIVVSTHIVSGFKEVGDYISLKVRIATAGNYEIKLNYGWTGDKGVVMKLQIGTWNQIKNGKAVTSQTRLKPEQASFGPIYLEKTPSNLEFEEMKISLLSRDVNDHSDVFWWLNLIEAIKA